MKTEYAKAAAAIKAELKKQFPAIKFSVKSSGFSMGDDVNISYTDGVPTKEIEAITNKYQQGSFDGMEDIYNYDNSRDDIPQSKYVFVDREISVEAAIKACEVANKKYGNRFKIETRTGYKGAIYWTSEPSDWDNNRLFRGVLNEMTF
jgi:hypothetical protein